MNGFLIFVVIEKYNSFMTKYLIYCFFSDVYMFPLLA